MAPTVYKSSDASAPVLTGQAGSLVALLDAALVNGYGSKTAAGWTKAFTATNKGSYLGTAGHYLDIDDSGAGAATTQEANARGYESMTAVGTGTNPFPTTTQRAAPGTYIRKSATTDATARGWVLIADGLTFYLFIFSGDTTGRYQSFGFGRFYSFQSADTYRSVIMGHTASGGASTTGLDANALGSLNNDSNGNPFIPRTYAGTGTSITGGLFGVGGSVYNAPFTGPNTPDGNIYISRLFLSETVLTVLRGYLRGLYQIVTGAGLNDGDTFTGAGDFAGRTFVVVSHPNTGVRLAVETTAWDSST